MSRSAIQRSFSGGELSPALYGRADLGKFQSGLKTCRNFVVMRHGGVQNRAGFRFQYEVKDSTQRTYLLPWIYSSDQTYALEVGDGYFRFYRNEDGGRVEVSGVAAYSAGTNYAVGDLVVSGGTHYYCVTVNGPATAVVGPPNVAYWYPLTGTIYEIPTPYASADLAGLQFAQQNDLVIVTHQGYRPRELRRTGDTAWTLEAYDEGPSIAAPTNLASTVPAYASGFRCAYGVTAVHALTGEESLCAILTDLGDLGSAGTPYQLTWDAVPEARAYRVYSGYNQDGGPVPVELLARKAETAALLYDDVGSQWLVRPEGGYYTPPTVNALFGSSDNYPATAAFYKQRVFFANTPANASRILTSRIGSQAMTTSAPLLDDDSVRFSLLGRGHHAIRHMVELQRLIVLTSAGEWIVKGDDTGSLTPTTINADQEGATGASAVPRPIIIGNSVVYLQARGTIFRDLRFELESDGYVGKDLTVFASHLFDEYAIERYDYAQIPHSVLWAVRNDGTLLGLTYMREQNVWGWHRHETAADGRFEDVCVLPVDDEDVLWTIVNRTIDGTTKRYIERLAPRVRSTSTDFPLQCFFVDSGISYDGRNTSGTTITLSTGGGWLQSDLLTVTASGATFAADDVGNEIWLEAADGAVVRVRISAYASATVVAGYAHKTVPAGLRGIARTTWSRAILALTGLDHLEGELVAVLGDGSVVFNGDPTDAIAAQFVVTGGAVTLPRRCVVINAGLPIRYPEIELLDLDVDGTAVRDKRKRIGSVSVMVEFSRGFWAAPSADATFREARPPVLNQGLAAAPAPYTGPIDVALSSSWELAGRVAIRQTDPLPLTILTVMPNGDIGG